jgi:hypothetical protein
MGFGDLLGLYAFEKYVLEICIATIERGGVTSKLDTYEFVSSLDAWGLPKYPDKTVILSPGANLRQEITAFIYQNETSLRESNCWLGTWIDPDTGDCYLDMTALYFHLEDAKREAITLSKRARRKIVALYDFKHGRSVYLWDERKQEETRAVSVPE